ncbi:hypothetical protein C8Q77DRAFT_1101092 [Trametes polyzona]|nr:hypothetical protein C8Q77DRAFT_1101092 [Trametes polyzona]
MKHSRMVSTGTPSEHNHAFTHDEPQPEEEGKDVDDHGTQRPTRPNRKPFTRTQEHKELVARALRTLRKARASQALGEPEESIELSHSIIEQSALAIWQSVARARPELLPSKTIFSTLSPDNLREGDWVDLSRLSHYAFKALQTVDGRTRPVELTRLTYHHIHRGEPIPFPENTQGFFYFAPHAEHDIAGEIRFRITKSRSPDSFQEGEDLLAPNALLPWRMPVLRMLDSRRAHYFKPIVDLLVRERHILREDVEAFKQLVDQAGLSSLWRPPYVGVPFVHNFRSGNPTVVWSMGHRPGGRSLEAMYIFWECTWAKVRGSHRGRAMFCMEPSATNPRDFVLRCQSIITPLLASRPYGVEVDPPPECGVSETTLARWRRSPDRWRIEPGQLVSLGDEPLVWRDVPGEYTAVSYMAGSLSFSHPPEVGSRPDCERSVPKVLLEVERALLEPRSCRNLPSCEWLQTLLCFI